MAYYDPRAATIPFSLFASQALTQREKAKEEADEKEKEKARKAQIAFGGYKAAEAKSIEDKTQALRLYNTLDERTATGRKYRFKDAPKEKGIRGWLKQKYATPGRERLELETRMKPGTKSFEVDDLTTTMRRPEGNVAYMKELENKAYKTGAARNLQRQKDVQNLETIQKRWGFGKEQPLGKFRSDMATGVARPDIRGGMASGLADVAREEAVAKKLEGYEGSLGGGPQGRTEELRIANVGTEADVRTTTAALKGLTDAQDPGYGPSIDPLKSPFKTTIGGGPLGFKARDTSYGDEYIKPYIKESTQSPPSGYKRSSPFPKTDTPSKVISETPAVKEMSPFSDWVDPAAKGGVSADVLKKFTESSDYIPGAEGAGGVLSPLAQYKKAYKLYGGGEKAIGAATTIKDATNLKKAVDTGATAAEAASVGEDVIGATGAKTVPGLGDVMTAVEMFDPDKSEEEKLYDAVSTGVGFVPGGQTLAAIMKGGKFLYNLRNLG